MSVAAAAQDLDPAHAMTGIGFGLDVLFRHRRPEAGPARARIELGLRAEQFLPAAGANVDAFLVIVPEFASESAFGPFLAHHLKLQRRQYLLPFIVGLYDLINLLRLHLLPGLPFRFRRLFGLLREAIRADQ